MTRSTTTTARPIPAAPADLSPASAELWPALAADVQATMGGADVDFLVLGDVLRVRDRLARIRAALDAEGVTVEGSKGQTRPHPLLSVESALSRELADGMARLRLSGRDRWRFTVGPDGRLRSPG